MHVLRIFSGLLLAWSWFPSCTPLRSQNKSAIFGSRDPFVHGPGLNPGLDLAEQKSRRLAAPSVISNLGPPLTISVNPISYDATNNFHVFNIISTGLEMQSISVGTFAVRMGNKDALSAYIRIGTVLSVSRKSLEDGIECSDASVAFYAPSFSLSTDDYLSCSFGGAVVDVPSTGELWVQVRPKNRLSNCLRTFSLLSYSFSLATLERSNGFPGVTLGRMWEIQLTRQSFTRMETPHLATIASTLSTSFQALCFIILL